MKQYKIQVENYYKESLQVVLEFLENAGAKIVSYDDKAIYSEVIVNYAGDDFQEVMTEIEETNVAGCHIHNWIQVR